MAGRSFAAIGLLLFAFAATACNATGETDAPTRTPAPSITTSVAPAVSTPVAMRGTWTADVQGTSSSSGAWTLEITESNLALTNPVGGDPFTLDPVSMTDTTLVLPAGSDCPDQSVVTAGTYTLKLSGGTLTIGLVSDSCGDRSAVLVTSPWSRKG